MATWTKILKNLSLVMTRLVDQMTKQNAFKIIPPILQYVNV